MIEVWIRKAATSPQEHLQSIDPDALPVEVVTHRDVQYNGTYRYRGIALSRLIAKCRPPTEVDIVLLHFANGMVVPLPFRDDRTMSRLDPFVARAMEMGRESGFSLGRFPPMPKKAEGFTDLHPLSFGTNRLIVSERWHPELPENTEEVFSPWALVDTLVGIEFAVSASYFHQLEIRKGNTLLGGAKVFRQSCQFCHAVRGIGGGFGWDFIEPEPIYSDAWMRHFRSAEMTIQGARDARADLYAHVKFRIPNSGGRLMPALRHLTRPEVEDLWTWIHAVSRQQMPPYAP